MIINPTQGHGHEPTVQDDDPWKTLNQGLCDPDYFILHL